MARERAFYVICVDLLPGQVSLISSFLTYQSRNEKGDYIMAWNNGIERRKFEGEQEKLAAEYRAAGMTEEQIGQMYQFDLDAFNSRRRFCEHVQQFPENLLEESEDDKSPLLEKFLRELSEDFSLHSSKDRYWWIEEIDDPSLLKEIKALPREDIELITLYVFEEFTQGEIAEILGVNQSTICRRLEAKKKFLEKFLRNA
jgi:DNA-directed RNA polymerase specialized sigma subunit